MNPAYEDREQTAVKHRVLARYLEAAIPIVGNWAHDIAFIDCMAGPWHSTEPDLSDTSFARAINVMRSTRQILAARGKHPTMRCLLIEKNAAAYEKLHEYCRQIKDIEITPREWDFTEHIEDIVQFAKSRKKSFPFCFIDPTGWESVLVPVLTPLLRLVPGEVLINLMTSWVKRFLSDESKHLERLLGQEVPRLLTLSGDEQEEHLVRCYADSVQEAGGYSYVCSLPILKPDQDAFHYHLIYGTRHEKGVQVFKDTEKTVIPFMHETRAQAQQRRRIAQTGQQPMFDASALYKEKKFTSYQARAVLAAKTKLRSILEKRKCLAYDDAWATAMENATVLELDLREWLEEWKKAGLIEIKNLTPRQRVPQKGKQHFIEWVSRT